jgi:hypothetical protein
MPILVHGGKHIDAVKAQQNDSESSHTGTPTRITQRVPIHSSPNKEGSQRDQGMDSPAPKCPGMTKNVSERDVVAVDVEYLLNDFVVVSILKEVGLGSDPHLEIEQDCER